MSPVFTKEECISVHPLTYSGPGGERRIDTANAKYFEQECDWALILSRRNSPPLPLVVEFSGVDFMSSAGLRVLISTMKRAKSTLNDQKEVDVLLNNVPGRIYDALDSAGFVPLFKIQRN